jgi:hypothetical protein
MAKAATQFRSATYRDRVITVRLDAENWELLIDGKTEAVRRPTSQEEAFAWLRLRVDTLIAEAMFPGLRLERVGRLETTETRADREDVHANPG